MKVKPIYIIALSLALALTIAVCDGRRIRDKYSISIGNYQADLDQSKKDGAALTLQIAKANEIVGQKDKEIAAILANADQPSPADVEKDKVIAALKKKNAELAAAGDYKTAYEGAQAEISAWSEKFTLAEERHKTELFDLNAAWTVKYEAQVVISESWKAKYESELHLRTLAEKGWKASERKLKWTRVMGNIKSGLIVGALGYIGYSAIKGT